MLARSLSFTRLWMAALTVSCLACPSQAQDLRVYTVIRNGADEGVLGRNLTLFHAGKVYDYTEPARELTVYDAAHKQFEVLNLGRRVATSISQEQMRYFLKLVETDANKVLDQVHEQSDPDQLAAAQMLEFQLHPLFRSQFDRDKQLLTMHSKVMQYKVECTTDAIPEAVARYLDYADSIAQLNSVLHPQAPLPAARLRVNDQLREIKQLPVKVEMTVNPGKTPVRLKAEHQWMWKLTTADRSKIHEWETQLKEEGLRRLEFAEYQKEVLSNPGVARLGPRKN
ncbi:hypothetical protein [Planctellipticum variicoloris]|uniref:hypothetical protein n=1 Tax=Planctellipticum variicoloris TaxID=3064265 RepID=UPI0030135B44|nr:hypothetical protein SH412_000306 [Planctomycetaceae bacterium SH412]